MTLTRMGEQCRWEEAVPRAPKEAWGLGARNASGGLRVF